MEKAECARLKIQTGSCYSNRSPRHVKVKTIVEIS